MAYNVSLIPWPDFLNLAVQIYNTYFASPFENDIIGAMFLSKLKFREVSSKGKVQLPIPRAKTKSFLYFQHLATPSARQMNFESKQTGGYRSVTSDLLTGRISKAGVKWVSVLQFYWLFFCSSWWSNRFEKVKCPSYFSLLQLLSGICESTS